MSKKTIIRLGLLFALLGGLWRLWESDAAVNALILFGTAGIVPGTSIELTPEQVYIVLGTVLFVAVAALFGKEIARLARKAVRVERPRRTAAMAQPEPQPIAKVEVPMFTSSTTTAPESTSPIVITLPAQPVYLQKAWRRLRPHLIVALGTSLEVLIRMLQQVMHLLVRTSFTIATYTMQAWLWAEPYLRRFDKWIEQTLKRNKDIATLLQFLGESSKAIYLQTAELRSRLTRALRTPEK